MGEGGNGGSGTGGSSGGGGGSTGSGIGENDGQPPTPSTVHCINFTLLSGLQLPHGAMTQLFMSFRCHVIRSIHVFLLILPSPSSNEALLQFAPLYFHFHDLKKLYFPPPTGPARRFKRICEHIQSLILANRQALSPVGAMIGRRRVSRDSSDTSSCGSMSDREIIPLRYNK